MADFTRFISFSVEQKYEGKYGLRRNLMLALYILFAIGVLALCIVVLGEGFGILIGVILSPTLLMKVLKPLTWKFVKTEQRYTMQSGTWDLYTDHIEKSIDPIYRRKVKEAEVIVPMTEENVAAYITGKTFGQTFDLRGDVKAEDAYLAIFPEEDGSKTLIEFVATNDALSIMYFYNKATVVTPVSH